MFFCSLLICVVLLGNSCTSDLDVDNRGVEENIAVIAENTSDIEVLRIDIDIWNFVFAFLAFGVGIFAAVFDWKGYRASKRTADNVVRVTEEVQIAQFNDLVRHFHRNLICSLAMSYKQVSASEHNSYIAESHLYKLKTLPEDIIHTESYNTNKELYSRMHELKLLLRNYDTEIEVALMHFKDKNISVNDLIRIDFDNLLFKPYFLISKIVTIEKEVYSNQAFVIDKDPLKQAICILICAHLNNIRSKYSSLSRIASIPQLNESLKEGIYESLMRGTGRLTSMMESPYIMTMEDILSENNPFIDQDTIEFISRAGSKFKGTVLEDYDSGRYLGLLTSSEFDAVQMLYYAIAVDSELERETIKSLDIH